MGLTKYPAKPRLLSVVQKYDWVQSRQTATYFLQGVIRSNTFLFPKLHPGLSSTN